MFEKAIVRALRQPRHFTLHNAPFDLQVIDHDFGVTIEELGPRAFDTRIMAHLLDPRQRHEGGRGLRLKELAEIYVDPTVPDTEKELHAIFRKEYKATRETGWALIDIDHRSMSSTPASTRSRPGACSTSSCRWSGTSG